MCGGGRSKTLDYLKGIGILLMVLGHSGAPAKTWIYLFHMALFFVASGYLWRDKHVVDIYSCFRYIVGKLKKLWLPYVLTNSTFILFHNLLFDLGIFTNDRHFLEVAQGGFAVLSQKYTVEIIVDKLLRVLFFAESTQLGGAMWFFKTLFFISVGHAIFSCLVKHLHIMKFVSYGMLIIVCLVGTVAIQHETMLFYKIADRFGLKSFFAAYIAYLLGILLQKISWEEFVQKWAIVIGICCIPLLYVFDQYGDIHIDQGKIVNLPFFITVSVIGWFMVYSIAYLVELIGWNWLEYMGKHTVIIVAGHFFAFRIASAGYIYFTQGNPIFLAQFPVIYDVPYLWSVYTIIGIFLPLSIEYSYKLFLQKLKRVPLKGRI